MGRELVFFWLLPASTFQSSTTQVEGFEQSIAAQKKAPGKAVKQLVFAGEDFTKDAVLRLRDERLK